MCYLLHTHNPLLFHYLIFFIVSEISLPLEYKPFEEKPYSIHYCMVYAQKSIKIPQRLMNEDINEDISGQYSEQRQENNESFYNLFS